MGIDGRERGETPDTVGNLDDEFVCFFAASAQSRPTAILGNLYGNAD